MVWTQLLLAVAKKKKKSQTAKPSLIQTLTLTADRGYELFMPPFGKLSSLPQKELNQLHPDSLKTDKNQFFTQQ